jgi:pilus assembly protein Flp/PilA
LQIKDGSNCAAALDALFKCGELLEARHWYVKTATAEQKRERQLKEKLMLKVVQFLRDESGATAIEYGLIAAGIAVAIIAVVQGLGTKLTSTFQSVSDALK